jgi:hypothetical protein
MAAVKKSKKTQSTLKDVIPELLFSALAIGRRQDHHTRNKYWHGPEDTPCHDRKLISDCILNKLTKPVLKHTRKTGGRSYRENGK